MRLAFSAPVWVWLTGLVAASAVLRFLLGRGIHAPWIFIDELIYSELAKSVASSHDFLIRDQEYSHYGPLYPLLISPAWRVFSAVPQAYAAAKAINALVMSLSAVPAYFLARRVLERPHALLGALFAVAVPSLAYTGSLMTENLAYPLALTAVLALVLALERPTVLRALVLTGLCVLAFLTRAQAVALVPAVLAAPVLLALFRRRLAELRTYAVVYLPLGLGVVFVAAVQLARGRALSDLFGAYSFVGDLDYSPREVVEWLVFHVAALDLYVGIIPFAAFLILLAGARRASARDQAFLAAAAAVTAALLVEVAMFASSLTYVHRIAERSMFYAAPLLLIALVVWIERGMPRPRRVAPASALLAAALPAVLPFGRLLNDDARSDTFALVPWLVLRTHGIAPEAIRALVLLGSVAAAVLLLRVPVRLVAVLPLAVLAYLALVLVPVERQIRRAANDPLTVVANAGRMDWIDRAVGPDAHASVIWSGKTHDGLIWRTEFFNRSAGHIYDLAEPLRGGLPEEPSHVDRGGVVRDHLGRPVYGPFVLADRSVVIDGLPTAGSLDGELTLYRVEGPVRIAAELSGRYPGSTWFRPLATYTRRNCRGGTLSVEATADPEWFPLGQRVTAEVADRRVAAVDVPPGSAVVFAVPVAARAGRCEVRLKSALRAYDPAVRGFVGARYEVLAWQ